MWNSTVREVFYGLNIVVVCKPMLDSLCFEIFILLFYLGEFTVGETRTDFRGGRDTPLFLAEVSSLE